MPGRTLRTVLSLALLGGATIACGDDDDDLDQYQAVMNGANEVPAPTTPTNATGTATFTDRGTSFDYTITVNGITGVTGAHIHPGATGVAGGVLVPLFAATPATGAVNGTLVTGSFTSADIRPIGSNPVISMDSLRALMRNGTAYVNVHTTANAPGEIRGQIRPR